MSNSPLCPLPACPPPPPPTCIPGLLQDGMVLTGVQMMAANETLWHSYALRIQRIWCYFINNWTLAEQQRVRQRERTERKAVMDEQQLAFSAIWTVRIKEHVVKVSLEEQLGRVSAQRWEVLAPACVCNCTRESTFINVLVCKKIWAFWVSRSFFFLPPPPPPKPTKRL